jgi:hypothetical protein
MFHPLTLNHSDAPIQYTLAVGFHLVMVWVVIYYRSFQ